MKSENPKQNLVDSEIDLPPPRGVLPSGKATIVHGTLEREALVNSETAAREAIDQLCIENGGVRYVDFLLSMRKMGVGRLLANRALDEFGYLVNKDMIIQRR